MAGEDPEGEATFPDDRLSGASRVFDSFDRITGKCTDQGRRNQGRHSGRTPG